MAQHFIFHMNEFSWWRIWGLGSQNLSSQQWVASLSPGFEFSCLGRAPRPSGQGSTMAGRPVCLLRPDQVKSGEATIIRGMGWSSNGVVGLCWWTTIPNRRGFDHGTGMGLYMEVGTLQTMACHSETHESCHGLGKRQ